MTHTPNTALVVNPHSANGRTGRHWNRIETEVHAAVGDFEVFKTEGPGHGTQMVRKALREGFGRIISAGGDGTHFEVVNGFFDGLDPIRPDAELAILPLGTGSDLCRTLGIPRGPGALDVLANGRSVPADVGRAEFLDEEGEKRVRYFLSSSHIGLGGVVADRVNHHSKALGGFMSFFLAVVAARLKYRATHVELETTQETLSGEYLDIVVANGIFDAGGMRSAPHARMNSGTFEVYTIGKLGLIGSLLNVSRLYNGTQDKHPSVQRLTTDRIQLTSEKPLMVGLDGELGGCLPVRFEIVPAAIRIVAGPAAPGFA